MQKIMRIKTPHRFMLSTLRGYFIFGGALTVFGTSAMMAGDASAQRAGKIPTQITVSNARDLVLATFEIRSPDGKTVIASINEPLSAGASVKLKLIKPKGCTYLITAVYEDESDVIPVAQDLCKDSQIRLVD